MATSLTPGAVTPSPADQIAIDGIQQSIKDALENRARSYERVFLWNVRWESDDTRADKDAALFASIAKAMNLPQPTETVLPDTAPMPGVLLGPIILELHEEAEKVAGRSLIIVHYAGHGMIDVVGNLSLKARPNMPRSLSFEKWFSPLWDDDSIFERADVSFILDCCHAGNAFRALPSSGRIVELAAAVRHNQSALGNPNAVRLTMNNTFTAKLLDLVAQKIGDAKRKGTELREVSLIDLVSELASIQKHKARVPEYKIKLGRGGIGIPRRDITATASSHKKQGSSFDEEPHPPTLRRPLSAGDPQYSAVFKVEIENADILDQKPLELIKWLKGLDPQLGVNLMAVYKTWSFCLFLQAPMRLWFLLDGLPHFRLIEETFGGNRLGEALRMTEGRERGVSAVSKQKENVPLQASQRKG